MFNRVKKEGVGGITRLITGTPPPPPPHTHTPNHQEVSVEENQILILRQEGEEAAPQG
jgi:hypothetical protein